MIRNREGFSGRRRVGATRRESGRRLVGAGRSSDIAGELETAFSVAASDYLLSEAELETATARAQGLATPDWTRERWQETAPKRAERIASDADAIGSAIASDRALLTATL